VTDDERYLFGLAGYLVIPGVLSAADVALANEVIDRHAGEIRERVGKISLSGGSKTLDGNIGCGDLGGALAWEEPDGRPFRDMLVNRTVVPYLHEVLGPGFRLDHNLSIINMRRGAEGHVLHGSSGPGFDHHQYYIFRDGRLHNGLTVAAYQLTDIEPGDGGLCIVTGSHKGNLACPVAMRHGEACQEVVKKIAYKAGDCVIFTGAVTRGTLPCVTADHQRHTVLFRFSPGDLAYAPHAWLRR